METLTTFGQWVKARRRSLDLTQEQLARQAGCSPAAVKKIEADERRPSRQVALLLAEQLQIPEPQRAVFVQVARGELTLSRLPEPRMPDARPPGPVSRAPASSAPETSPRQQWTAAFHPPALQDSAPPKVNIPQPATPLVGRERELEKITRLLQDPTCRMLTLTGVGGTGKTRLAMEAALHLQQAFADGVYFVALASVDSSAFLVPAIAAALEVPFSGPADTQGQLFQALRGKQALLVLDNLEHLLDGAELFSALLQFAPRVKILATSREQLHLQAEWVFEVRGLPVPAGDEGQARDTSAADNSSAVLLFLQRARQVQADFSASPAEVAAIARICRLVQGLPLAIELAARWTRTLSCAEIAQEIERGLELLSSARPLPGAADAATRRHRSMRAVFDHSWALLTPEEQRVLMRLSVFRGGFRRESAEQVGGAGLPALSALIDKSLLWHREGAPSDTGTRAGTGRYGMHDLVQQYLAARLAEDPSEECAARWQHSRCCLTLLQKSEPGLRSRAQKDALAALDEEIDNLRLAWATALERVSSPSAAESAEALDLLYAAAEPLYYFYELHQNFQEAEALFRRAAEPVRARLGAASGAADSGADPRRLALILAHLLNFQAFFQQRPGNNAGALALFEESLSLLRGNPLAEQEPFPLAFALVHLGVARWAMGDFELAARSMEEGLAHSAAQPQGWLHTLALGFLGGVSHDRGDYPAARRLLHESITSCQAEGDPEITMLITLYYTRTLMALDEYAESRVLLESGLKAVQETGNRWLTALGLEYLARIARASGQERQALHLMEESIRLHRAVGDNWSLSLGLIELARALLLSGAYPAAEQHALEALKIVAETGYTPIALEALSILAAVDARQGRAAEALILIAHILGHPASKQDTRDQAAALRAEITASLAPQHLSAAEENARMRPFAAFLDERYGIPPGKI